GPSAWSSWGRVSPCKPSSRKNSALPVRAISPPPGSGRQWNIASGTPTPCSFKKLSAALPFSTRRASALTSQSASVCTRFRSAAGSPKSSGTGIPSIWPQCGCRCSSASCKGLKRSGRCVSIGLFRRFCARLAEVFGVVERDLHDGRRDHRSLLRADLECGTGRGLRGRDVSQADHLSQRRAEADARHPARDLAVLDHQVTLLRHG